MKHTLLILFVMLSGLSLLAQEESFDWYLYQASGDCETSIIVTGDGNMSPLYVELLYAENSVGVADVQAEETFEMVLPASTQAYGVAVYFDEVDRDAYRIDASLKCPLPVEDWADIEADFFDRVNWGPEEIQWFREVYTPLYGDPQGYILDQLELLDVLEAESTPAPALIEAPLPEPTAEATP